TGVKEHGEPRVIARSDERHIAYALHGGGRLGPETICGQPHVVLESGCDRALVFARKDVCTRCQDDHEEEDKHCGHDGAVGPNVSTPSLPWPCAVLVCHSSRAHGRPLWFRATS